MESEDHVFFCCDISQKMKDKTDGYDENAGERQNLLVIAAKKPYD